MAANPMIQAMIAQALAQDDGSNVLQQEVDAADVMGPEGMEKLVGLGTLDQRGQLAREGAMDQAGSLERQLAMAQAMATPKGKNYGTMGGNIAGGVGDALGAFFGGLQVKNLGEKQAGILSEGNRQQAGFLDQTDQGRLGFQNSRLEAIRKALTAKKMVPDQAQSDAHLLEPLV